MRQVISDVSTEDYVQRHVIRDNPYIFILANPYVSVGKTGLARAGHDLVQRVGVPSHSYNIGCAVVGVATLPTRVTWMRIEYPIKK